MKILVTVKQVPDTATQVKIGGDGKQIDTAGITVDRLALRRVRRGGGAADQGESAARARWSPSRSGPDRAKEALRSALAMGCDPRHPRQRPRARRRPTHSRRRGPGRW
jgi:hypothetical protein